MSTVETLLSKLIDVLSQGSGGAASNVDVVGNTAGLATGANIASVVTALGELSDINVNTDELEIKLDNLLTELQLKANLSETQPVSLVSVPLATGASTSALQAIGNASLSSIVNNVKSKLNRIKGATDYASFIVYVGATQNIATITHTGSTDLGSETLLATYTYDGSNRLTNIAYS